MGYDDDDRSGRRRSRGRQPVKRPGTREPEYRKNREPREPVYREPRESGYREPRESGYRESGYRESDYKESGYREGRYRDPELNLITDSFKEDDDRRGRDKRAAESDGRSGSRKQKGRSSGRKGSDRAAMQSAATSQDSTGIYRTPARKKAQKRRRKLMIIALEAVILLSVLAFAAYTYLDSRMGMIQRLPWDPSSIKNVEISQEKQEQMKGYWTIAIYGVDSRNDSIGKGNNADVNIICNINQDTGEIKLVSVFRDTYLNIKENNSYNKINAAYLQGGPEQAVRAMNRNLDLDIDDYAVFNWKAVADAINILDGIDLELSKAEFYYINAFVTETVKATGVPSEPVKHAGMVHLDGVQAVAYGRLRLMDTDYARTERQRKVIALAFEKAKKADWATLNNIIQTVFGQVATSVELPDILGMGRNISKLHLGESMGFPAARGEATIKGGACVIPQTLESNVKDLHRFLFGDEDYTPTDTVKNISKKIISDTGLAKAAKPVDHVNTDGGSIPKATKAAEKESKAKEPSASQSAEAGTAHETDADGRPVKESESGSDKDKNKKPGSTAGWEQWETDADGNWVDPALKESRSGTGTVKPGSLKPETVKPGTDATESTKETKSGTGTDKPKASQTTEAETSSPKPGYSTDTGVILRPGEGTGNNPNAPGSGGGSNVPGSGTGGGSGSGSNAPGSGSGGSSGAPGSGSGGTQNAPGSGANNNQGTSGGSGQAPGSGSGDVEFAGPMAP